MVHYFLLIPVMRNLLRHSLISSRLDVHSYIFSAWRIYEVFSRDDHIRWTYVGLIINLFKLDAELWDMERGRGRMQKVTILVLWSDIVTNNLLEVAIRAEWLFKQESAGVAVEEGWMLGFGARWKKWVVDIFVRTRYWVAKKARPMSFL